MHIKTGRRALLAILLFCFTVKSNGQRRMNSIEVGINLGTFIYQGDLTPERFGSSKTPGYQLSFFINKIISKSFSVRANFSIGKLRGDESLYKSPAYRQQRNFAFKTPVTEFAGLFVWDILNKNFSSEIHSGLRPYIMAGPGISFVHIKRDWSRFNSEYFAGTGLPARLTLDEQHSLPKILPVIPVGAGIRYSVSEKLSINAETIYRITFSDYIDGFSQAANPSRNDHYQSYSVGLIFSFDKKNRLNCPVLKN
ncbi:MAG: hypothetical protein JST17_14420 [Bacteroidetes bacterium]|nr:hypothetical protein [Bacteroidota bacterium]MBS1930685.1 hypothetical protein [Bacteroidota bacterium]